MDEIISFVTVDNFVYEFKYECSNKNDIDTFFQELVEESKKTDTRIKLNMSTTFMLPNPESNFLIQISLFKFKDKILELELEPINL